jgi:hypothetical protein
MERERIFTFDLKPFVAVSQHTGKFQFSVIHYAWDLV